MAKGLVAGKDFYEDFKVMKYWSFVSSWDKEKRKNELNKILYSGDYIASEKKDGYFERIIKDEDGNIFMCSRDKGVNGVIEKSAWVPHLHDFFSSLPNETVLLTEVYLPNKTSKNIVSVLGCLVDKAIARQKKDEDKLHLWVFDVLAYDGKALWEKPIKERISYLNHNYLDYSSSPYVQLAEYWDSPDDILENWLSILAAGGEGIVMTYGNYPYEFGKRAARKTLKLKKELEESIDVFLTGRWKEASYHYTGSALEDWPYWYDIVKEEKVFGMLSDRAVIGDGIDAVTRLWFHDMAGAVEIALMDDNKIIPIGWISGISDDIRSGIVEDPKAYQKKVAELQAMEIDTSGEIPTLRHARIIRWRDDKDWTECTFDQLGV